MRSILTTAAFLLVLNCPAYADDRSECLAGVSRLRIAATARPSPPNLQELQRTLRLAEGEAREREYKQCAAILKGRGGDDDDDNGPETEDMFGFTQGTDILEKGKFEISGEAEGAFRRRSGRYRAGTLKGTFAFAPFDHFSIELGAKGDAVSIRDVPELDNRRSSSFGGVSAELKWQAIKRGSSPFGLTFVAEPELTFRDEDEGVRGRGFGLETRLAFDTELIPQTVFGGLNLIYELERFRPRGLTLFNAEGEELEGPASGVCSTAYADDDDDAAANGAAETCISFGRQPPAERSSRAGISGALAFQVLPNVFIGAEARYLRSYGGLGLNGFKGHALFLGPTFYSKLSNNLSISAAFSTQVAGKSEDSPDRRLDLDNFSHHQAKLKISYEF